MKKTIPTSIAHILFYIEEDAYSELHSYLESIRNYFKPHADSSEIISDIESRIAEQLIEYSGEPTAKNGRIVTLEYVTKLIASMGTPKDFGDADSNENTANSTDTSPKQNHARKFYRDPDNAQIAGVASGLAAYFNMDPVVVRLLFIVVVLLGGSGILIYIILWIIIPEAKTTSQKLEMRGDPINLETVSGVIKEKIEEVKNRKSNRRGVVRGFLGAIQKVLYFVADRFIPIIGKVIGSVLVFASVVSSVALISALLICIIHPETLLLAIPISLGLSSLTYVMLLIGVFLTAIVPFFLLGELGLLFIHRHTKTRNMGFLLIALWLLGIIMTLVIAIPIANRYHLEHPDFNNRNTEIQVVNSY